LITGQAIRVDSIPVASGWNLIGSISSGVPVTGIGSDPGGIVTSNFFGYLSSYFIADTIKPGYGYWVKVNQAGRLVLTASGNIPPTARIRIVPTTELPPALPDSILASRQSVFPTGYGLEQNYPNPFNPTTNFAFSVPEGAYVTLRIFDVLGRAIATVVDEPLGPGYYKRTWDAGNIPTGMYYYRLTAGSFSETRKLVVVR
jgi:hypothetical protein